MDSKIHLQLNVQLLDNSNIYQQDTLLESFIRDELHNLMPEFENENNNAGWKEVKERLGEKITQKQNLSKIYLGTSLAINGLLIGGILFSKLWRGQK
jgi:hypothetical protein